MKAITILIALLLAGRADDAAPRSYFDEDSYKQCKELSYVYEQRACIAQLKANRRRELRELRLLERQMKEKCSKLSKRKLYRIVRHGDEIEALRASDLISECERFADWK